MTTCPNCSGPVIKTATKGRPRIFCSYECKEAFHGVKKSIARAAELAGRSCAFCNAPIEGRNAAAVCCSDACSVKYNNRRKAARLAEARRSARSGRQCESCGGIIPDDRRLSARFCSLRCQRTNAVMRHYQNGLNRKRLYDITPEQYEAMLVAQDGRCAICRATEAGGKGGWHVDHCHDTGKIRGLLCNCCNLMLGHAQDDSARLLAAVEYLTQA